MENSDLKRFIRVRLSGRAVRAAAWMLAIGSVCLTSTASHGDPGKLRILVDKVLSSAGQPLLTAGQLQEIADAGFNVVSPRWGGTSSGNVFNQAILVQGSDLEYMPWIRATTPTSDNNRKMVWADGTLESFLHPNDSGLWNNIEALLVDHANTSQSFSSMLGTFLDFENYAPDGRSEHGYQLSYDMTIMNAFAADQSITLPALLPAERYPWLVTNGHHDAFAAFQINSWRQRMAAVRQQIDAINPNYRLCIYPAPGSLFMFEAVLPEWSTPAAPIMLADASSFFRPMLYFKEFVSVDQNRQRMLEHIALVQQTGLPFSYLGGLDPIGDLNNPEFYGKSADMLASAADGYWVFYEGPTYGQADHEAMFDWFTQANASITSGAFSLQHVPRQADEILGPASVDDSPGNPNPLLVHEGLTISMHENELGASGLYEVDWMESLRPEYLAGVDILLLQANKRFRPMTPYMAYSLRDYVHQGGRLFLTHLGWSKAGCAPAFHQHELGQPRTSVHDDASYLASLFPEVATWALPSQGGQGHHVVDTSVLEVSAAHPIAAGLSVGSTFNTTSPDHMVLSPSGSAETVIVNTHGDPVIVAGEFGRGKIVYSGCYYGYTSPYHNSDTLSGNERSVFYAALNWLVTPPANMNSECFDSSVDPMWTWVNTANATPSGLLTPGLLTINSMCCILVEAYYTTTAVERANAEIILTAYETRDAADPRSAFATALWIRTSTCEYVLGVRVEDLGASQYRTTLELFSDAGATPTLLGSYVLPDSDRAEHRYNVEVDGGGQIRVYVDALHQDAAPVITAACGGGGTPVVRFGDIKTSFASPTVIANGHSDWNKVTLSSQALLPLAPVRAQEYCGDDGTVVMAGDVTGPYGVPDCYVNLLDFNAMSQWWMQCTDPANPSCL
jgi:hypothetical protein